MRHLRGPDGAAVFAHFATGTAATAAVGAAGALQAVGMGWAAATVQVVAGTVIVAVGAITLVGVGGAGHRGHGTARRAAVALAVPVAMARLAADLVVVALGLAQMMALRFARFSQSSAFGIGMPSSGWLPSAVANTERFGLVDDGRVAIPVFHVWRGWERLRDANWAGPMDEQVQSARRDSYIAAVAAGLPRRQADRLVRVRKRSASAPILALVLGYLFLPAVTTPVTPYGMKAPEGQILAATQRKPAAEVLADASDQPKGIEYRIGRGSRVRYEFDDDFRFDPSASPTAADRRSWLRWGATSYGARVLRPDLDDAVAGYEHYRGGTGGPVVVDLAEAYREDIEVRTAVDTEIRAAVDAAKRLGAGTSAQTFPIVGTVWSGRTATENWNKTLGMYLLWGTADVRLDGTRVTVTVTVHVLDRYNFNREGLDLATAIPDEANGRFEQLGWARGFDVTGSLTRTFTAEIGSPAVERGPAAPSRLSAAEDRGDQQAMTRPYGVPVQEWHERRAWLEFLGIALVPALLFWRLVAGLGTIHRRWTLLRSSRDAAGNPRRKGERSGVLVLAGGLGVLRSPVAEFATAAAWVVLVVAGAVVVRIVLRWLARAPGIRRTGPPRVDPDSGLGIEDPAVGPVGARPSPRDVIAAVGDGRQHQGPGARAPPTGDRAVEGPAAGSSAVVPSRSGWLRTALRAVGRLIRVVVVALAVFGTVVLGVSGGETAAAPVAATTSVAAASGMSSTPTTAAAANEASVRVQVRVLGGMTVDELVELLDGSRAMVMTENPQRFPDEAALDRVRRGETLWVRFDGAVVSRPGHSLSYYAAVFGTPVESIVALNPDLYPEGTSPDDLPIKRRVVVVAPPAPPSAEPPAPPPPATTAPPSPTGPTSVPTGEVPALATSFWRALLLAGGAVLGLMLAAAGGYVVLRHRGRILGVLLKLVGGVRSLGRRAARSVRWDVPMPPGEARTRTAAVATVLTGMSIGLLLSAASTVTGVVGMAVGTIAAVMANRVLWSVRQSPGRVGDRVAGASDQQAWFRHITRTGRSILAAGWGGMALLGAVVATVVAFAAWQPATAPVLLAVLIAQGGLVFRAVLNRQTGNRDIRGRETAPFKDAAVSAGAAVLVAAVYNVIRLLYLPQAQSVVVEGAVLLALLAALLGSVVQRKLIGSERLWNALYAGIGAVPTTLVVTQLALASPPVDVTSYVVSLGTWMAVAAAATMFVEYSTWATGAVLSAFSGWMRGGAQSAIAARLAGGRAVGPVRITALVSVNRLWLNFLRFRGPPDWILVATRMLSSAAIVVVTHVVVRPLGTTPFLAVLPVVAGAVLLPLVWRFLDAVEIRLGILGSIGTRTMRMSERPIRLRGRAEGQLRRLAARLEELLHVVRDEERQSHRLLHPQLAASVASDLEDLRGEPAPVPLALLELQAFPGLEREARALARRWDELQKTDGRISALIVLMVAAGDEVRQETRAPLTPVARQILAFHHQLVDALASAQTPEFDGQLGRSRIEDVLQTALTARREERLQFLEDFRDLLQSWHDRLLQDDASSDEVNAAAAAGAVVLDQLELGYLRTVPSRTMLAARLFLEGVRDEAELALAGERALRARPETEGRLSHAELTERIALLEGKRAAAAVESGIVHAQDELELHRSERVRWSRAADAAWAAPAGAAPAVVAPQALLGVALDLAGRTAPVSPHELAGDRLDEVAAWRAVLDALVGARLAERDEAGGYRAGPELREAWRAVRPQLRGALQRDAGALPGGSGLEVLLVSTEAPRAALDVRRGATALLELLARAAVVYSRPSPGLAADLDRLRLRRQDAHWEAPEERLVGESSADDGASRGNRTPAAVIGELVAAVRAARRATHQWRRADFAVHRARGGREAHDADANAPPGSEDAPRVDDGPLAEELRSAARAREQRYEQLRALAARVRTVDFPAPGARPALVTRALELAGWELAHAPGTGAGTTLPLKRQLRRVATELGAARRRLKRLLAAEARGSAPWVAAVHTARRALAALELVERDARSTQLIAQFVPRRALNRAVKEADRLRHLVPDELVAPPVDAGALLSGR